MKLLSGWQLSLLHVFPVPLAGRRTTLRDGLADRRPERIRIVTQSELNRAVAAATRESVRTIARMGFVPLTPIPFEREPLTPDWDEIDAKRVGIFPKRRRQGPVPK